MVKKHEWFKQPKKQKEKKETDAMKFAKDALVLTGGIAVLGAGLKLLD